MPAQGGRKAAADKKGSVANTPETVTEKSGNRDDGKSSESKVVAEPAAKPVENKQPEKASTESK